MAAPYPQLKRALLSPLAAEKGLSYDLEMLEPGRAPEQHAFHFVSCGSDILGMFIYKENFPSDNKRTRRTFRVDTSTFRRTLRRLLRSLEGTWEVPHPRGSLVTMRLEAEVRMGLLGRLVAEVMGRRGRSDTEAILAFREGHGERAAAQRAGRRRLRRQTATTVVAAR